MKKTIGYSHIQGVLPKWRTIYTDSVKWEKLEHFLREILGLPE